MLTALTLCTVTDFRSAGRPQLNDAVKHERIPSKHVLSDIQTDRGNRDGAGTTVWAHRWHECLILIASSRPSIRATFGATNGPQKNVHSHHSVPGDIDLDQRGFSQDRYYSFRKTKGRLGWLFAACP